MADNRNFVNKFANQGGGDIFVEDARLSESTSTTTVTTEGLLLKGTDGAYYEIDKASLSEVIRAELGAILADNSKNNGTSVGKVPTLNSTGNALGASSVADLATVLGGFQILSTITTEGAIDNIQTPFYVCRASKGYTNVWQNIIGIKLSNTDFMQVAISAFKRNDGAYFTPKYRYGSIVGGVINWDVWGDFV